MGTDYVIFYTEASLVCILILSIMLVNDRLHGTRQETQMFFNRAIVSFILYFVSDAFWAAVLGGVLPRTRALVVFFNGTNYLLLSLMAYSWFMYMAAAEKMPFRKSRKKKLLCFLPTALSCLGLMIAYIADPYYWVDRNNELCALYYPVMIFVPTLYLLAAFAISMVNARKTERRDEKKQCWLIGIFPLGVLGFGLAQVAVLNAPTFCFGCTVMIIFFYIQHMQMMISVDALTRLNNRGQINRYIEQITDRDHIREIAMMIDIDGFKEINDTYGHAEGDRALVLVSEALKKTGEGLKIPMFLGRYGGDEFLLIMQPPEGGIWPETVAGILRQEVEKKQEENRLPYRLEVSIGYDELRDKNDTMKDCLVRADENLYREKRAKGAGR